MIAYKKGLSKIHCSLGLDTDFTPKDIPVTAAALDPNSSTSITAL